MAVRKAGMNGCGRLGGNVLGANAEPGRTDNEVGASNDHGPVEIKEEGVSSGCVDGRSAGQGAVEGGCYIRGHAGERFGVRKSGAVAGV